MGMDVYGLNPQLNEGSERPEQPDFSNLTEEEKRQYFDSVEKFERENPGYYFRANIWWWRPLWQYVVEVTDDVLTEEDIVRGMYNEGYEYPPEKTDALVTKLGKAIEDNHHHQWDRDYKKAIAELDDEAFEKNYPFDPEVVEDFYKFLKQSGGFMIC